VRYVSPELHQKRAEAGRKGGYATFFKHGREQMRDWAKMGGRPGNITLAEARDRQSSLEQKEIEIRRNRLTAGNSLRTLTGMLKIKIKEGELAVNVPLRSPEGASRC